MTMWHCEKCLGTPGVGVGCVCAAQPAASAEPSDEEIIRIYSKTLAEHVDGRGYRAGIIAAGRALLSKYAAPVNEQDAKDAERLDFLINDEAQVTSMHLIGKSPRYRLAWPEYGEVQSEWFAKPREAIDAAIAQQGKEGA